MNQDQRIAYNAAYDHGFENGRRDKLLGQRSEYAWNCGNGLDVATSYVAAYSLGYRAGFSHECDLCER